MRLWITLAFVFSFSCLTASVVSAAAVAPAPEKLLIKVTPQDVVEYDRNLIIEIISALLGIDLGAIITQAELTVSGLYELAEASFLELEKILVDSTTVIKEEIETILNNALKELEEILQPFIDIFGKLKPYEKRTEGKIEIKSFDLANVDKGIIDIIENYLGMTIPEFIELINTSVKRLEDLVLKTVEDLEKVATSTGEQTAAALRALIDQTLSDAEKLIQPLLDLLKPIFPKAPPLIKPMPVE